MKLININKLATLLNLYNNKTGKLSTYTIRYWEKLSSKLKPSSLINGRRYYAEKEIKKFQLLVYLTKRQGLTLKSAIKIVNDKINSLDEYKLLSVKDSSVRDTLFKKTQKILLKINNLKKNGKKNTY